MAEYDTTEKREEYLRAQLAAETRKSLKYESLKVDDKKYVSNPIEVLDIEDVEFDKLLLKYNER